MQVFFAEVAVLPRLLEMDVVLPPIAAKVLAQVELPPGTPFFLEEDGSPMPHLNDFFRVLPELRCPSPETWRGYALDILGFHVFLARRNGSVRSILDAGYSDFAAYRRSRLEGADTRVDPKTWNRSLSAFDKFFAWAVSEGIVEKSPFTYVDRNVMTNMGRKTVGCNTLLEAVDDDEEQVKCISVEDYRFFRDVGLRGFLPGRTDRDRTFRGRSGQRNAALADMLVGTGMRITEALSIFRDELPANFERKGSQHVVLARRTTKNRRRRKILVPNRCLNECVSHYYRKDRQHAVEGALKAGRYQGAHFVPVASAGERTYRIGLGGHRQTLTFDNMPPRHRRRMLAVDEDGRVVGPSVFWLNQRGLPLTDGNVRMIFSEACKRCRKWRRIDCSPHTLRHTFAVHMLTILLRLSIGSIDGLRGRSAGSVEHQLRQITMNPLDALRRLLGHRSMETTLKYLTYVVESREYVEAAFDRWSDETDHMHAMAELALVEPVEG